MADIAAAARGRAVLALMLASGFAGLGYQIVWTQQASLWLGHEAAAVLAVITAFFGGLALGALTLGRRVERSRHPARWYAACEAVIAAWSLVLALAMGPISQLLLGVIGAEPSPLWHLGVAFAGCFLMLLPATVAMGATLPAMERLLAGLAPARSPIAMLYASNTFGAVLGVLATAFWLVPSFGLARTALLCAALNGLCAVTALRLAPAASAATARGDDAGAPAAFTSAPVRRAMPLLAATGFLGIGYEVLVVRVLSQVSENTVYTFAILLAIYLAGTALGAAAYGRCAPAQPGPAWRDGLLTLVAAACLAGTASLWSAEGLRDAALAWRGAAGPGTLASALAAEALPALLAFALPTVAMGALFSHLATEARAAGVGLGRTLGANTLGAAAAPPLLAWGLVPLLGSGGALLALVAGYLLLVRFSAWPRARVAGLAAAVVVVAVAVWAPPLAFIDVPEGGRVLSYREGPLAAVSVVADADGVARLRINNRQQEGSSATLLADARQALLPLLLHPAPRRALFLGLGTGVTASAAAADATLQVDAVELLPEVIAASALFRTAGSASPRLVAADARRFVKAEGPTYDVIVSDNFHPARSGSALLYTEEHFRAVGARLAPGGLFCQWMPLHQIDVQTLRSVVRSFLAAFPDGAALLATNSLQTPVLGLVAGQEATRFSLAAVQARIANHAGHAGPPNLPDLGLGDAFAVLGSLAGDSAALHRFAGSAPRNTDDRPVVAYLAPRITYAPDSAPADRLQVLLAELAVPQADPARLVDAGAEPGWLPRLAAYWAAREAFIEAGRAVRPAADVQQMLAQVQAPLLAVLKTSPDFRPAFEPLQRMAQQLQRSDPLAAQPLLEALAEIESLRAPAPADSPVASSAPKAAAGCCRSEPRTPRQRSAPS